MSVKQVKECLVMDYPWTNGITTNQSVSPNKTDFDYINNGYYDSTENAYHAYLIQKANYSMNLDQPWIIEYDYKMMGTNYADWFRLFSFGYHYGYAGRDVITGISIFTGANGGNPNSEYIYTIENSDILYRKWNKFTLKGYSGNIIEFYLNDELKWTFNYPYPDQNYFYLNGTGTRGQMESYVRNFKFALGINKIIVYNSVSNNLELSE